MKCIFRILAAVMLLSTLNHQLSTAFAQGTAFTYQGRLNDNGAAANGNYDLTFTLYSAPGIVAGPVTNLMTAVSNGLFTTTIDFGVVVFINYSNSLLQIGVRTNGTGSFNTLSPQQPLTRTPYALTALNANSASSAGSVAAANISGTILNSSLPASPAFSGANVTNVNATALGGLNKTNFWQTGGNSGTTAGVNYLGTPDNQPLELHVNGQRAMRLEPTATVPNVIGGYSGNMADNGAQGATVGGGGTAGFVNHVSSTLGTIAGGSGNIISTNANDSTIGGGRLNKIDLGAWGAIIAGGVDNWIQYGTNGGGNGGSFNSSYSTVSGGFGNIIQTNAIDATVIGGDGNTILANTAGATILGGTDNTAGGFNSLAAGFGAAALHDGSFVWADHSLPSGLTFASTGPNQFLIHAAGNVGINTATPGSELTVVQANAGGRGAELSLVNPAASTAGNEVAINFGTDPTSYNGDGGNAQIKVRSQGLSNASDMIFSTWNGNTFGERLRILAGGNVGIGTANPAATLDVNGTIDSTGLSVNGGIYASGINSGGGTFQNQLTVGTVGGSYLQYQTFSFTVITSGPEPAIIKSADLRVESDLDVLGSVNSSSSRDLKTNFAPADVTTTLKKVLALPLQTWRFTNEVAGIRHLGPMSQDFYSAFNLGKSERFISSVDEGGVALAAIQGLNQKVEEKDKEIQELKTRLEKLEQFLNSKTGETK